MKNFKRIIALVLTFVMIFSLTGCTNETGVEDDGTQTEIVTAINAAGKYLTKKITDPTYGDEAAIIALNRSTYIDYWHNRSTLYVTGLEHVFRKNAGVLGDGKTIWAEGYPDVILAHTAVGILADLSSAAVITQGISYDSVVMQGGYLNKIEALIALECGKYEVYEKGDLTRQDLIDFVMSLKQQDGSFTYKGMDDVTPVKVTATAVTALALTGETDTDITTAVSEGVEYLIDHIREDDSIDDITSTIIALNTTGHTAQDVEGKDLTQWLLKYQREDGSCSENTEDKKGNVDDTAKVLLGLASQYRFNTGMTSVYDMSDVLGGTHNKLSPEWQMNVKLMTYFIYFLVAFLLGLYLLSRYRIWKWKKEGIWDAEKGRMMSDEDIAKVMRAKEAAARGEEIPAETAEETVSETEENTDAEEKTEE